MPPIVATLATANSYKDLTLFLSSLSLCYSRADAPTVYLYCDTETMEKVTADNNPLYIVFNSCLDAYSGLTRQEMEAVRRPTGTLWLEFQMEKLKLLDWVFQSDSDTATKDGVFYLDSDICFFGPLPSIPSTATVALSPHYIRERDEARFGRYNGGFLWMNDARAIDAWRLACATSRFHEQAALECLDKWDGVHLFPPQVNYGWWRMFQGSLTPQDLQAKWSSGSEVTVDGTPLQSVHTHFFNPSERACQLFNEFVIGKLKQIPNNKLNNLLVQ